MDNTLGCGCLKWSNDDDMYHSVDRGAGISKQEDLTIG